MPFAPSLPDNAPFSTAQRAWVNGYLAGLLSLDAGPGAAAAIASSSPSGITLSDAIDTTALAEPVDEDFPWHDPALSLDERLALAEGRKPERILMAAMAQLDCGQCGYLCRSYAEAISSGAEKSLSRCVPGGKATSRKLKELFATVGAPAAPPPSAGPAAAIVAIGPAPAGPNQVGPSPDLPFPARLRQALCLNGEGSEKEIRHIVIEAEPGGAGYRVGDSLGVHASNCPDLVQGIIERLGAGPDTAVQCPDGVERALFDALSRRCEIRRPSDQAIEVLASRAHDRDESRVLQAIAEGYPGAGPDDADLLDLLETFPSARPPLSELISSLDPLQPRLYSIASSPKLAEREVHLAVAAVRYQRRARRRTGVASTFLCDRVGRDGELSIFVRPSENFRLAPSEAPIIMIGPGTGIAPFRAFLQERRAVAAQGRNWLFFGNPRRRTDFLFEDELTRYREDGLLTRLDTAFSRDQESKIYVQHRLLESGPELWSWLEDGAYLYVCGDADQMARDVDRGLAYIVAKQGGMDAGGAKAYLARLSAAGRYQRDVY